MNAMPNNTPIIIGVGQSVSQWNPAALSTDAPSPIGMANLASRRAIDDVGLSVSFGQKIDTLALVRTMADSLPATQYPLGAPVNAPGALAHQLNIQPNKLIYAQVGGDTPQALVSEMAERIYNGETKLALIAGGEATGAMKAARRAHIDLDWSAPAHGDCEDRGFGPPLLSAYELRHGLVFPTQVYALFENALRRKQGLNLAQYRAQMAALFAPFSNIAAGNPYAQFGQARSVDFLRTPSPENYDISTPYLKWHVAQDAVNQGAALLMTSVGMAKRMGVPMDKWIYLHVSAQARDTFLTERPDLSTSQSTKFVLDKVLASSGLDIAKISYIDLYSCFPCAVFIAAQALGIDWRIQNQQGRPLTVTGGLPFFGAPGNNYSMHAIATMVEHLRKDQNGYGLILANGGYLTKQATGIYSAKPAHDWTPVSNICREVTIKNKHLSKIDKAPTHAKLIAHTINYYKGEPVSGFALCQTDQGRCLAKIVPNDKINLQRLAMGKNLEKVSITTNNGVNYIS